MEANIEGANVKNFNKTSLFPAYSVETQPASSSLFPAYASLEVNASSDSKDNSWLQNSSYTPNNYQESSFLPKNEELSETHLNVLTETDTSKIDRKRKKHQKKLQKKQLSKHRVPDLKSYQVEESHSIRSQLNKKIFIEETGLSFERAFRVDGKSDPENIYYECLGQKYIAKYKLYPKTPVGFSATERNVWNSTTQQESKEPPLRYFSKKALKSLKAVLNENNVIVKSDVSSSVQDFIPLQISCSGSSSFAVAAKPDFEGVSKAWKSSFDKPINRKTCEDDDCRTDSELHKKIASFNKRLSKNPHSIQLWLDFVNFQDELLNSPEAEKSNLSLTESSLIDKKVAILNKALKHNPKNVQLHIAKLNLCQHVWQIERVISSWDELVFLNPNDPQVWKEYVKFMLTNLSCFKTPRVLKVFAKCIRTLSNISEGVTQSHAAPENLMVDMIDIFSQLCHILRSCGYSEKSVAAFQALVEFNLFSPPANESLTVAEQISCFEPFWDCGAARFGEEGAIGWAATVEQKKISFASIVTESDLSAFEDDILCQKYPEWKTWLEFEHMRETHHWLPWRPNPDYDQTDDDIDDEDRSVSFDDISKYLFQIQTEQHKFLMLLQFLDSLGFNPHQFGCSLPFRSQDSSPLTVHNFDLISKKLNDVLFCDTNSNPLDFERNIWSDDRVHFVKNIFSQAVGVFSCKYKVILSQLWLKFLKSVTTNRTSSTGSIDEVKKFAKTLLKEPTNRNCLLLWFEYITAELFSSCEAKAKKTAETLLASSTMAVASGAMRGNELWYFVRSCVDFTLDFNSSCISHKELFSRSEITGILMHIGCSEIYVPRSTEPIKPTQILKAVSGFKAYLNEEMSAIENLRTDVCYCLDPYAYSIVDCIKCYSYFLYFSKGIDAAVEVLDDLNHLLKSKVANTYRRYVLELLCIYKAELLQFHTRSSNAPTKPLFLHLYSSLEEYPNSVLLFYILVRWRTASSVISPTRRFFSKILRETSKVGPIPWIFAIASELLISHSIMNANQDSDARYPEIISSNTGIKWKIRSLYEKAVDSPICGFIPIFWKSYLKFEILNNEPGKAKGIFHRALQNCGWSKDLVLYGVENFPDDLKQLIEFMVEKQIRMHTPLEEVNLLMEHGIQE